MWYFIEKIAGLAEGVIFSITDLMAQMDPHLV
jgi:hypothetical protein